MGRNAGYIALWCGIANGAEDILLPEKYDYDEQKIINNIIENRRKGKKHHIIVNAEGIGHSTSMARRIEAATGLRYGHCNALAGVFPDNLPAVAAVCLPLYGVRFP